MTTDQIPDDFRIDVRNMTVPELCGRYGESPATIEQWVAAVDQHQAEETADDSDETETVDGPEPAPDETDDGAGSTTAYHFRIPTGKVHTVRASDQQSALEVAVSDYSEFGLSADDFEPVDADETEPETDGGTDRDETDQGAADVDWHPDTVLEGDRRTLPHGLLERRQWAVWQLQEFDGRTRKVIEVPWASGREADDVGALTDFATADRYRAMTTGGTQYDTAFRLLPTGPFACIDLDDCIPNPPDDPLDTTLDDLTDFARDIVERCDSFTEVSQSGTGLHIFVRATVDDIYQNKAVVDGDEIEVYDRNRGICVTGWQLAGTPREIEDRQELVDDLSEEYLPEGGTEFGGGDYDGDYDADTPFEGLRVADVYGDAFPLDQRHAHPVHGSSNTGSNFMVTGGSGGALARCWRCRAGSTDGTALNALHLLAMEAAKDPEYPHADGDLLGVDDPSDPSSWSCVTVREAFKDSERAPALWFAAYHYAAAHVDDEKLSFDVDPAPYQVIRHVAIDELGIDISDGGAPAEVAHRQARRILRSKYGLEVSVTDKPGSDELDGTGNLRVVSAPAGSGAGAGGSR